MSHLEQDVFVATSWDRDQILTLERACQDIGLQARNLGRSEVNCYWTIVVPTSGSKSGWPEKERHEQALQLLMDVVRGMGAVGWFWASYGGDRGAAVVREHGPTPADVERNEARALSQPLANDEIWVDVLRVAIAAPPGATKDQILEEIESKALAALSAAVGALPSATKEEIVTRSLVALSRAREAGR